MSIDYWKNKFEKFYHGYKFSDPSHDVSHFQRVWTTARKIAEKESGPDLLVILAGAYFHDYECLPKNHPDRKHSSRYSATMASTLLREMGFPAEKIPFVSHAIEAHSFSAGIVPETIEAKILQDADRIEALGAIGIARVFAVNGQLNRSLFHADDPTAKHRDLDDKTYGLDHFYLKLFELEKSLNTNGGRQIGRERTDYMESFVKQLVSEISI